MGLDVSFDCWHGAYSAFARWRTKLAEVAGLPPLSLMEGFYQNTDVKDCYGNIINPLPIRWSSLKSSILYILLYHSDCDGSIAWKDCKPLADRLTELLPLLDGDGGGHIGSYREKTQMFIDGLLRAYGAREDVEFT